MTDQLSQLREDAAYERTHPSASIVGAMSALGLKPGMHVLDIGCRAGAHLQLFADGIDPDGLVVGLDIDSDALAIAADLNAELVASSAVRLREGDLHQLPFDDASFDVAWMSAVLHHVEKPIDALTEMTRVVRAGGLVAILDGDTDGSFPCLPWSPEFEHALRAASLRAQREHFGGTLPYAFDGYIGRQLPGLFSDAGLTDARMQAFAHVESSPMSAHAEAALCHWFLESLGQRVRDFLTPRDRDRLANYFTPASPDYLPSRPEFFMARMSFLATGHVPAGTSRNSHAG